MKGVIRGTATDLMKLVVTVIVGGIAAVLPRPTHRPLLDAVATIGNLVGRRKTTELAEILKSQLRQLDDRERRRVAEAMRTVRLEHTMCRGYGVFRDGWPADVSVVGIEHLQAAAQQGRGVVLWVMTFLDLTPLNRSTASAGFPLTHLSSPKHGLRAASSISRRFVAPLLLRGEKRSQARRIIIPDSGGYGYLRDMRSVVADERGVVSIRGDTDMYGRVSVDVPFLGGQVPYPTGAPSLAHRTGAPLLTAAVVRTGPLRHQVVIDEPIAVPRDLDRSDFQRQAIQEFGIRREARARLHPESRPWYYALRGR